MDRQPLGFWIVVAGLAVVVVGLLVWGGALGWFGRLPGDVRVERENVRLYFPITSMLLASALLSLLVALLRRLL
ncbi:MAG TPA: DUF2905 domain-containing protein [Rubricoccaceae bacterium]|jgi:heme/copper-type cytochrome/quinol oxidase subunit 1|nr:DUF2905 domain-containing protein [Rubricoccaceae bacterium]